MRMSHLFGRTLRQAPAEAESESYRLILRAGLARPVAAGIYCYLPLGWRVLDKIARIVREEMNRIDGQEILMPVIVPAELWKESGRWFAIDETLWRIQDRSARAFVLAMTHEEVVTDLTRREVRSYRQLPYMLYQIQTKVRDEPRPRGGLLRMREFLMKDAYSFHPDTADLDRYYPRVYEAYERIYQRIGVPAIPVQADPGLIGGTGSHEFILPTEIGEAVIVRCTACTYAANQEIAVARRPTFYTDIAAAAPPPELVRTPGIRTIEELERFFQLPPDAFLKTVVYTADGRLVAAVVPGDSEVNEIKLARVVHADRLRLATDDELRSAGISPGFVSPVGLQGAEIVVDHGIRPQAYVAGANRPDHHLKNVLPGRDFPMALVADLTVARAGQACILCGDALIEQRGLELGHTFKLGVKYSEAMGARYLGPDGQEKPIVMGCYGIGLDRLLTAVVEINRDGKGIVWPPSVAPFQVHLLGLNLDQPRVIAAAEQLYHDLVVGGVETLYDDRPESPGVKFADADLIGLPLRVTVSERSLRQGSVELTPRRTGQSNLVALDQAVATITGQIRAAIP